MTAAPEFAARATARASTSVGRRPDGYRILETGQTPHIDCQARGDTGPDASWSLTTNDQQAVSAEFDDEPYADLLQTKARR